MEQVLLKKEVERVVGHQLKEARDFEELSLQLLGGTRERLPPTTLKRQWGCLWLRIDLIECLQTLQTAKI